MREITISVWVCDSGHKHRTKGAAARCEHPSESRHQRRIDSLERLEERARYVFVDRTTQAEAARRAGCCVSVLRTSMYKVVRLARKEDPSLSYNVSALFLDERGAEIWELFLRAKATLVSELERDMEWAA